jgi:hypothetical protein
VKGFEGKRMSLALGRLMILIVLHSQIIIMKAQPDQSNLTELSLLLFWGVKRPKIPAFGLTR